MLPIHLCAGAKPAVDASSFTGRQRRGTADGTALGVHGWGIMARTHGQGGQDSSRWDLRFLEILEGGDGKVFFFPPNRWVFHGCPTFHFQIVGQDSSMLANCRTQKLTCLVHPQSEYQGPTQKPQPYIYIIYHER